MRKPTPVELARAHEDRYIGDLKRQLGDTPMGRSRKANTPSQSSGTASVAWYRGRHLGAQEAHDFLAKKYPGAAKWLCKNYRPQLEESGT